MGPARREPTVKDDGRVVTRPASAGSDLPAALRGFGPIGIVAILVILFVGQPLISGILILLWAYWSGTPWRDIGYVRPKSWIGATALGIVFGVAFKLFLKAVILPLLGADPINHAYHYIAGNTAALPGILFAVTIGAGFGEETLFRGYMFERLGKLFGRSTLATTGIVLLTSTWFGLVHYPEQGLAGAQQAAIVGLAYGTIFAITGRLWMLMVAHAAFDITAVAIIYWGLETRVAHILF
jgi:membrane protease YdiL (CAAX protease family)